MKDSLPWVQVARDFTDHPLDLHPTDVLHRELLAKRLRDNSWHKGQFIHLLQKEEGSPFDAWEWALQKSQHHLLLGVNLFAQPRSYFHEDFRELHEHGDDVLVGD